MAKDKTYKAIEWWKDKTFVAGLNKDVANWESGKDKGYTLEEVGKLIEVLKKKRAKLTK